MPHRGSSSISVTFRSLRGAATLAALAVLVAPPVVAQAAAASTAAPVAAPDTLEALRDEIAALRRDYEQRLSTLEAKLAELAAQQAAAPPPVVAQTPAEAAPPAPPPASTPGGSSQAANYFNPAISVVANFLAVGGHNPVENLPSASLRETEIGLQAVIDPYARADFFLAVSEEGIEVEEGYATFTSLPWNLLAKVGRQRIAFGKVNTLHLHNLPWPDEPLPIVNLLGGEEGWKGDGLTVARLVPLGDTFSELTLQVLRGEAENLFAADRRSDLAYNAHYRLFRDLTDATNLDVGLSWALGPTDGAAGRQTRLSALDLTWRWKPLQTGLYRSFLARGEVFRSDRDQPGGRQRALGWYLAGDVQLGRRWFLGGRLERSERLADAALVDDGAALALTFWPSEFSLLRAELRRRRYAERVTADEILLQLQFIIGAHTAHPF